MVSIEVTDLKCLLRNKHNPHHKHHEHIAICCHSSADNTKVQVWNFKSNPDFNGLKGFPGMEDNIPFVTSPLNDGDDVLVFGLAVRSTSLSSSQEDVLIVQGTGIFDPKDADDNSDDHFSKRGKVFIHEIMPPDNNKQEVVSEAIFEIELLFTRHGDGETWLPKRGTPLPSWIDRYTRESIAHAYSDLRHHGEVKAGKLFNFSIGGKPGGVSTSTDWIGGRPYPIWKTAPHLITSQTLVHRENMVKAVLEVAQKQIHPSSTNRLLSWAQKAATLIPTAFPYMDDFYIFDQEDWGEDKRRDVTFWTTVFGAGDCEDFAFLCAFFWRIIRGTPIKGYEEVQAEMKKCSEPYVCYCLYPTASSYMPHATCLVFDPKGAPLILDGVQIVESFLNDDAGLKADAMLHHARNWSAAASLCDVRVSVSTHREGQFATRFIAVYLLDKDGNFCFLGDEGRLFNNLSLDTVNKMGWKTAFEDDNKSWRLKPQPPLQFERISTVASGLWSTDSKDWKGTEKFVEEFYPIHVVRGDKDILGNEITEFFNGSREYEVADVTISSPRKDLVYRVYHVQTHGDIY